MAEADPDVPIPHTTSSPAAEVVIDGPVGDAEALWLPIDVALSNEPMPLKSTIPTTNWPAGDVLVTWMEVNPDPKLIP
jgi:hypothetical protein